MRVRPLQVVALFLITATAPRGAAAQTEVGMGVPCALPLSSPFGFSTRNTGTTVAPRCSAVATSCQSFGLT